MAWTGGPANNLTRPTNLPYYDSGLYLMVGGSATSRNDLVLIKNDPAYNEQWPRALVPYRAIYGVDEPHQLAWLPNNGSSPSLPAGTPYGIIGTSSLYKRESAPGIGGPWDGLDSLITQAGASSNWVRQGADVGRYNNADIWGVRILALEPTSQGGRREWFNHANERMRVLGEIPTRKAVMDPEGNPDTSFSAMIPADTPVTFQMIDSRGRTLAMAQTWHQVRPGETRTNCGGCHAHSQVPLSFASTAAASLPPTDLTTSRPRDVEFLRDIRPLLQRSCVSCHSGTTAPASLNLNDLGLYAGTYPESTSISHPGDYMRLARDSGARWGIKPWTSDRQWRFPQASRYIRKMQSRRSLLAWYVAGARLDGWTNADHPSESVPGNPTTLPGGTESTYLADVDFVDTVNHGRMLSEAEQRLVFTWIDLGAPIDMGAYFQDELRPTLTVSVPRPNQNVGPLTEVRVGAADVGSGLDVSSLRVEGLAVGARSQVAPGVFTFPLLTPLPSGSGRVTVSVRDLAGNITRQDVRFTVGTTTQPTPAEVCGDGIDNDGDGLVDEGCAPPPAEVCGDGIDNDGDGLVDEGCAPPPAEVCGDGIDNDGDGLVDEGCRAPTTTDNTAPLIASLSVAQIGRSGHIAAVVVVTDNVAVANVSLSLDGRLRATLTTSPYVFELSRVPQGSHVLTATARDAAGNQASRTANVVVARAK